MPLVRVIVLLSLPVGRVWPAAGCAEMDEPFAASRFAVRLSGVEDEAEEEDEEDEEVLVCVKAACWAANCLKDWRERSSFLTISCSSLSFSRIIAHPSLRVVLSSLSGRVSAEEGRRAQRRRTEGERERQEGRT